MEREINPSRKTLTEYLERSVLEAEPERLVLMLYQGAIRFISEAERAIEDRRLDRAHLKILRAHAIIGELSATLDLEKGRDIAKNLALTYDYVLHLLTEADITKDRSLLVTARGLLEPLAEAWEEAFYGKEETAPSPPSPSQNGEREGEPARRLDLTG